MREKSTDLSWVATGEDGWRWELRSAKSSHNYEGKVLRFGCLGSAYVEAWHSPSNTVDVFDTFAQAAAWLVEQVTK